MSEEVKPLVYVAGPYTRPDPITNTQAAVDVAEAVHAAGGVPLVPHLTMLWHLISPHDLDFWYAYDLEVMRRCDAVYRIPGDSTGADAEIADANERGQLVFHELHLLLDWIAGQ